MTIILIALGFLIFGIIILSFLYFLRIGPYGDTYNYRNLRTWKAEESLNDWLTPIFDYGDNDRNVPSPDIKNVYCKFDPIRCITNQENFNNETSHPPC